MDRAFKEALEAGTAESFRRYGVDAKLNGNSVQVIVSTETMTFGFSDGDASPDTQIEVTALASDWRKYKVQRVTSNSLTIEGETYKVSSARPLPGIPTIQLSLRYANT